MKKLLTKIFPPKYFTGIVRSVTQVSGEFDQDGKQWQNFHKQPITEHKGNDKDGMPIKDEYIEAVYDVTLRNDKGEEKVFRTLGRDPIIGSEISYHMRQERGN